MSKSKAKNHSKTKPSKAVKPAEPVQPVVPPDVVAPEPEPFTTLPTYDSLNQCAGATGIPLKLIKRAKKSGCPAFKSNRVYLEPLLRWIFGKDGDNVDWGDKLKRWQALRQEIAYNHDRDETLTKSEVRTAIGKAMAALFSAMDRRSTIDLPSSLKGLAEAQIQARLLASDEALKASVKAEIASLMGRQPAKAEKV